MYQWCYSPVSECVNVFAIFIVTLHLMYVVDGYIAWTFTRIIYGLTATELRQRVKRKHIYF